MYHEKQNSLKIQESIINNTFLRSPMTLFLRLKHLLKYRNFMSHLLLI